MPAPDTQEDAFGFSPRMNATKEKIQQIKPASPPALAADMSVIDAAANKAGFVSREPTVYAEAMYPLVRKQRVEPRIPLNMRIPVSIGAVFQRFCDENRYSYPEGLEEIMRKAGLIKS